MAPETQVTQMNLLRISEVASILRVSKATAYRLREEQAFESIMVRGQYRVPESSLRTYMTPKPKEVIACTRRP